MARVKMEIEPKHLTNHGIVCRGAIFMLDDAALAIASNYHGIPLASINPNISYLKSVSSGIIFAEA